MELIELQLSIRSIDILQKAGMWCVDDILAKMAIVPSVASLAMSKICNEDFDVIMVEIKKRTKSVLDNNIETQ